MATGRMLNVLAALAETTVKTCGPTEKGGGEMTSYEIFRMADSLRRIGQRLHEVETATRRKRTPGRISQIVEGDDLSEWNSDLLEISHRLKLPLVEIAGEAEDVAQRLFEAWRIKGGLSG